MEQKNPQDSPLPVHNDIIGQAFESAHIYVYVYQPRACRHAKSWLTS